mmetsp:Transcript_10713/g.24864  ORF Transcript_10713/g.24864 Transcript_10713/m.24864 type:complete len:383 (+) Transcript_10713:631-1779(+)
MRPEEPAEDPEGAAALSLSAASSALDASLRPRARAEELARAPSGSSKGERARLLAGARLPALASPPPLASVPPLTPERPPELRGLGAVTLSPSAPSSSGGMVSLPAGGCGGATAGARTASKEGRQSASSTEREESHEISFALMTCRACLPQALWPLPTSHVHSTGCEIPACNATVCCESAEEAISATTASITASSSGSSRASPSPDSGMCVGAVDGDRLPLAANPSTAAPMRGESNAPAAPAGRASNCSESACLAAVAAGAPLAGGLGRIASSWKSESTCESSASRSIWARRSISSPLSTSKLVVSALRPGPLSPTPRSLLMHAGCDARHESSELPGPSRYDLPDATPDNRSTSCVSPAPRRHEAIAESGRSGFEATRSCAP